MSSGIDFVIGGRDKAKPAMDSVEKSLSRLEAKTDSLGNATSKLTMLTTGLAVAYGAIKSAMALLRGLDSINAAYDESAEAVKGLETALRLQGASVEVESPRLQQFATDMKKLTGESDDAILAMMKQASMMGVATEDLDDMAKAAIGLGEATGTDAASGMDMMRKAQEGNFMALERMLPAMRQLQTDEEKLAFVTDLAAKGLDAKAEAANRVTGMGGRASEAVGDLMESVGALLAPIRILISTGIKTLAESLSTLLVPAVQWAEEVLANIGPLMDWVREKIINSVNAIIAAFTWFEVVITNLDQVWILVVSQAELSMLQMAGAIKHTLMEVIPAYAVWFGENFLTMLTGGFDDAMAALPDIAVRAISEREQELAAKMGLVGANLGQEFADKFADRMVGLGDGMGDEFDKEINLAVNKQVDAALGKKGAGGGATTSINAMESRLLTRGPGLAVQDPVVTAIRDVIKSTKETTGAIHKNTAVANQVRGHAAKIEFNTANPVIAVPII